MLTGDETGKNARKHTFFCDTPVLLFYFEDYYIVYNFKIGVTRVFDKYGQNQGFSDMSRLVLLRFDEKCDFFIFLLYHWQLLYYLADHLHPARIRKSVTVHFT